MWKELVEYFTNKTIFRSLYCNHTTFVYYTNNFNLIAYTMKKSLLIIIIFLLIGIGVAVFVNFPKTQTNIQTQEIPLSGEIISSWNNTSWATDFLSGVSGEITSWTIQPVTWTTNPQNKNPLVYTNTEFWFQLTLPEGWEDYKAFVYSKTDILPASIVIALPTTTPWYKWIIDPKNSNNFSKSNTWSYTYIKNYANMLDMIIIDKKTYEEKYKTCKEFPEPWCLGDVLWNNNEYYYIVIWPQELTLDLDEKWWDRSYFDKIYKNFKIL